MIDFKMPQLGETVLEATITRWLKGEGDPVEEDEPLVEVSTDKVDSEIPSPASGTVSKILVPEGETVEVGSVLARIGSAGEGDGSPPPAASRSRSSETPQSAHASPARPAAPQPSPAAGGGASDAGSGGDAGGGDGFRGVLSPLVRRLAAEHQVDIESVTGTGAGGRITKQDVLRVAGSRPQSPSAAEEAPPEAAPAEAAPREPAEPAAPPAARPAAAAAAPGAAPSAAASAAAPPARSAPAGDRPAAAGDRQQQPEAPARGSGLEEVVQVSPMRRAIAEHMVASMTSTARAWNVIEVDLGRVARLREAAGNAFKLHEGFSLTWMPFICKAVTQTLLAFPQLNSTWNGDGTITRKHYVNLGIAVALENGLIVPVIKGAEAMNLIGLARAIRDIADRARGKKLSPDDVQGGTFTVTNPGGFGSVMSVPIINRGQAAILSSDAVVKRPVVITDELGQESIAIRPMIYLSISWDHRIIDGAEAARFLAHLKKLLEEADFEPDLGGLLQG